MHLIEVRQSLNDTAVERDIYDINKIIRKLTEYTDFTEELSYTDYLYISTLLSKTKTLLYKAYTIFEVDNN